MGERNGIFIARLCRIEGARNPSMGFVPETGDRLMEFHVSRKARDEFGFDSSLFGATGNVIIPDFHAARLLARRINEKTEASIVPERSVRAGRLNAMALIDEILHDVARLFRERVMPDAFSTALTALEAELGRAELDALLLAFVEDFPPLEVYKGGMLAEAWLAAKARPGNGSPSGGASAPSNRELAIEELLLLKLANANPAFGPFRFLFDDGGPEGRDDPSASPTGLAALPAYSRAMAAIEKRFADLGAAGAVFGPDAEDLVTMMRAPVRAAPYSLPGQLDFMRTRWGLVLSDKLRRLLGGLDLIREEEKPFFPGPGPTRALAYAGMEKEYERFSQDRDWMPNVVMMAKSTLVWLHQLSVAYAREVRRLDQIPDEELDILASRGFNALWLIGLWERSAASERIKRTCGNPEAAASAYSLFDYEIAAELGGWAALEALRARCAMRGIKLAADMVPNHVGLDSAWVREKPELFVQTDRPPFPGYSFEGQDLSGDGSVEIKIEDHYYDRTDAAVVFRRVDRRSGETRYIYHGNDGTGLPWSDTAQIDFLRADAREAVKERILHVARNFPIIRFDAAMILAKRSFRRLWYPEPGKGGDIPSRAERALSAAEFDAAFPEEFWREVVDLCAKEAPDTLLLAEAFWMMEGYFVRTLGMHRVYNSAFMNMLKREENAKYRETIRNTQEFDKDILKRFVNFMNNPDEDTAVAQFGSGDKYFGVCTMMATMPGLPMFGHGQLEGFSEKYGMEYRRAYRDEAPDAALVARHEREIFPLLKRRRLFSGVERFLLYDLVGSDGSVNENVFVWSNGSGDERAMVAYNNAFGRAEGRVGLSAPFAEKLEGGEKRLTRERLSAALGLRDEDGRFLVMREQRSGLWFIRRSSEIAGPGLHIILNGYESQVFFDINEVADDERGLYRAIHDELRGRGVPDLSDAIQDLVLKELYSLLASLVGGGLFSRVRSLALGGIASANSAADAGAASVKAVLSAGTSASGGPRDPNGASTLLREIAPAALGFYAAARKLMRSEASDEGLPGDPPFETAKVSFGEKRSAADSPTEGAAATTPLAAAEAALDAEAAARAADRFLAGVAGLAALGSDSVGRSETLSATEGGLAIFAQALRAPGRVETCVAYLVLDGLIGLVGRKEPGEEAAKVADRFCLERKLRDALRDSGVHGDEAYRGMAEARALLPRLGAGSAAGASDMGDRLLRLFASAPSDEEIRAYLGANVFDGIAWYRKESFEGFLGLALVVAYAAACAESGAGRRKPSAATAKARPSARDEKNGGFERAAKKTVAAAEQEAVRLAEGIVAAGKIITEADAATGYRLRDFAAAIRAFLPEPAAKTPKAAKTKTSRAASASEPTKTPARNPSRSTASRAASKGEPKAKGASGATPRPAAKKRPKPGDASDTVKG